MNAFPTVDVLAIEAQRIWGKIIREGEQCALLDFPDHPNVGDSAIWAGERVLLNGLGARIKYSCRDTTFNEHSLRKVLPEGTLLLHGGGNFGTLWPSHQQFRERILRDFRDYRIVQLPQTIFFDDVAVARSARKAIAEHPDFTLMVRDSASAAFAEEHLGLTATTCPDSAFALAGRPKPSTPAIDCLVLARTDKEKLDGTLAIQGLPGRTVEACDWMIESTPPLARISRRFKQAALRPIGANGVFQRAMLAIWDRTADIRLARGVALLGRGRVVVTDRLHAHILCALLGIPNVIVDNNYGKLAGVWNAWTSGLPGCYRATSPADAMAVASKLIRD